MHWHNDPVTTMEKWRTVRNTEALQKFLMNHKNEAVRQLLPNNFEMEQDSDTDTDFQTPIQMMNKINSLLLLVVCRKTIENTQRSIIMYW